MAVCHRESQKKKLGDGFASLPGAVADRSLKNFDGRTGWVWIFGTISPCVRLNAVKRKEEEL